MVERCDKPERRQCLPVDPSHKICGEFDKEAPPGEALTASPGEGLGGKEEL